ncbi:DUF6940 family protein [Pontibacter sp. G13]|uniref:DUF6940 family protein n=1 Tax=Pontibacter sp. G13 TaxID=3074898 RepID=UPI002889DE20|nr:hypothetical protein [Pontibacter sp. G13]WNJ16808.1 hypothetical protein RJD25_18220 [Pontibacter sp. G13]
MTKTASMSFTITSLDPRTDRYQFRENGTAISFQSALDRWKQEPSFTRAFVGALSEARFSAFFWEMPPFNLDSLNQPFEFILKDSPKLAIVPPEPAPFKPYRHLAPTLPDGSPGQAFAMPNLGGDAQLVIPTETTSIEAYAHISSFSRQAPESQHWAFWHTVADEIQQRVSDAPLWVSTSGLGVYWLHVRLDARPKYYTHAPYRAFP